MIPSTEHRVLDIVATCLGRERAELSRETDFARDLEIDSLDAVNIQMAVEEHFDIELPEDMVECVISVHDLIQAIEALWSEYQRNHAV